MGCARFLSAPSSLPFRDNSVYLIAAETKLLSSLLLDTWGWSSLELIQVWLRLFFCVPSRNRSSLFPSYHELVESAHGAQMCSETRQPLTPQISWCWFNMDTLRFLSCKVFLGKTWLQAYHLTWKEQMLMGKPVSFLSLTNGNRETVEQIWISRGSIACRR